MVAGDPPHRRVADLRREYASQPLHRGDLAADPLTVFLAWFDEAVGAGEEEANAMALATATADAAPAVRMVLLKGADAEGFSFYTNLGSPKALALAQNPRAALVFRWASLNRQVRVTGPVVEISADEADAYFKSRPRGSQLGAWASEQSRPVPDRSTLDAQVAAVASRFGDGPVPRPPFWSGFRVVPLVIEFWQGRTDRLHDRFEYRRSVPGAAWQITRLSP